jgi:hypothetical protein
MLLISSAMRLLGLLFDFIMLEFMQLPRGEVWNCLPDFDIFTFTQFTLILPPLIPETKDLARLEQRHYLTHSNVKSFKIPFLYSIKINLY